VTLPDPRIPRDVGLEWRLLALTARTNASSSAEEAIHEAASRASDWQLFVGLAWRHGVTGLVSTTLSRLPGAQVPSGPRGSLADAHRAVARANLRLTWDLHRVLGILAEEEIPVIPLKGPVLASRAYGDVSLRSFVDLDLLVREEDLSAGMRALQAAGLTPEPSHSQIPEELLRRWGSAVPFITDDGSPVELHWRLSSAFWQSRLEPPALFARAAPRDWMGRPVLWLTTEDQLLFLCTHASRHGWSRLIWICDVAETLRSEEVDWAELLPRAAEVGALRILHLGVRLARSLLGAPVEPHVLGRFPVDPLVARLEKQVLRVSSGEEVSALSEFLVHVRSRDRIEDQWAFFFGSVLTPSTEDLVSGYGRMPVSAYPLWRVLRLTRKYLRERRGPLGWRWERGLPKGLMPDRGAARPLRGEES
jgi:hypothetical protein